VKFPRTDLLSNETRSGTRVGKRVDRGDLARGCLQQKRLRDVRAGTISDLEFKKLYLECGNCPLLLNVEWLLNENICPHCARQVGEPEPLLVVSFLMRVEPVDFAHVFSLLEDCAYVSPPNAETG